MSSQGVPSACSARRDLRLTAGLLGVVLAAAVSGCASRGPSSAVAAPLPQIGGWFGTAQGVKPTQVQFSVDNSEHASDAKWYQYDQNEAAAYATMNLNDCTPTCVNGHWQQRPVRLHFYHNSEGRLTIGEVFYLDGTSNLFGRAYEPWDFN